MKTLELPYVKGLENASLEEFDLLMEKEAAKGNIDEVNWAESFPYRPDCNFAVALTDNHLAIRYNVRGLDLRAENLEDNGNVWEDSCCEFFCSDPSDGTYYNFEMNCIGTLLASKRKSREDFVRYDKDTLAQIRRFSTLERKPVSVNGKIFTWTTGLLIPFKLIGFHTFSKPDSIRANFYKCADKSAHPHFVSWNRIEIEQPDFHRPDFFGELILGQ